MNENDRPDAADDGVAELEAQIARVRAAQAQFAAYTQEQVDTVFKAAAIAADKARIPVTTSGTAGSTLNYAEVDILDTRSISGTFVVQDAVPVAIGGLITETSSRVIKRVPILGRIPLLGWLFRSTEKVKQRTELIVMIRPHVISTPAEGEGISRKVLEGLSEHPARDGRPSIDVLREGDKPFDSVGKALDKGESRQ